jgi:thioredoxin-related protein
VGNAVHWENDYAVALRKARAENKPVLLSFFNPESAGCRLMDAVTYTKKEVVSFLNKFVVSVRVPLDAKPLADELNVHSAPVSLIVDWKGDEHIRTVGFRAPKEFLLSILAVVAKIYMT